MSRDEDKKLNLVVLGLALSTLFIFIRSVYRTIELLGKLPLDASDLRPSSADADSVPSLLFLRWLGESTFALASRGRCTQAALTLLFSSLHLDWTHHRQPATLQPPRYVGQFRFRL